MIRSLILSSCLLLHAGLAIADEDIPSNTWIVVAGHPGTGRGPWPFVTRSGANPPPTQDKELPVTGSTDGKGAAALFHAPGNITVDDAGTLYVLDQGDSVVRKIESDGTVTTLTSLPGGHPGTVSEDHDGIAVDHGGNLYVSVVANGTILKIARDGAKTLYAGSEHVIGYQNGPAAKARFDKPQGLTLDSAGDLYIADSGNNVIRKITRDGLVTTVAGGRKGLKDGPARQARFESPVSLAVDHTGNIYVAESMVVGDEGRADPSCAIRRISADGNVVTLAEDAHGRAREGRQAPQRGTDDWLAMQSNTSIAVDAGGLVYFVVDGGVARFDPSLHHPYGAEDPVDISIGEDMPPLTSIVGMALTSQGDIYVSDSDLSTIFRASPPPGDPSERR